MSRFALALLCLTLCSCGSNSPTYSPVPLVVALPNGGTTLALDAAATSARIVVSESGYHGTFSASSSNAAVARVSAPVSLDASSAAFTVYAVGDGTTTIRAADDAGHARSFAVDVKERPSASPSPTSRATANPTATPVTPTPSATPTGSPGPLSASPAALTFNSIAQTQSVTLADPGTSSFTVSGCTGTAILGSVANGTFDVTSVAAGSCSIDVSDAYSHHVMIPVSVTTLVVPIQ